MTTNTKLKYLTNDKGKTVSAVIPINEYYELLKIAELYEELEMLEDIKTYKEAKKEPDDYEPFDLVVKRIEDGRNEKKIKIYD